VRYVVRSADFLIRHRLGWKRGLADPRVRLLDPAAGPMTFIAEVIRVAAEEAAHIPSGFPALVSRHLLPHCRALEVLPDLAAAGRDSMRRLLRSLGYEFRAGDRISLRVADALRRGTAPAASVVLGNPPWSGHSANRDPWITDLLHGYELPDGRVDEGYYRVDGRPLGERNPKWLQDDCVKFLRLAQWTVDRKGEGVVGFVVSHTCLEAPTFRGLRRSLLRSFEEIYALDLHGDRRKKERGPGGEGDENVFPGVRQGSAVLLLVKKAGLRRRVFRADLYGSREAKLAVLGGTDVATTSWREVCPRAPAYLFAASDRGREREFARGTPLTEIMPLHSTGVVTGRDAVFTAFDRDAFESQVGALCREGADWPRRLTSFLVHPFDLRHLFYAERLLARPRRSVMGHLCGRQNLGLVLGRQSKEPFGSLVTRWVTGHKAVSAYDVSSVFPLYRYVAAPGSGELRRVPNLCGRLLARLAVRFGEEPLPETALAYLYAVLYSPPYRVRYRALLVREYPRIRFPQDQAGFLRLASLGEELVRLHLLTDLRLLDSPIRCEGDPCARIGRDLDYRPSEGRLLLAGGALTFEGLSPEVWHYRIGGYQVLAAYLRARAGRVLAHEESRDFRRTAAAIAATVAIETRLAAAYGDTEMAEAS
jgi:predicted helicase